VYLISDSFVGEDIVLNIAVRLRPFHLKLYLLFLQLTAKIDDVSVLNADEQGAEDEISDQKKITLAGQMAAMRVGL